MLSSDSSWVVREKMEQTPPRGGRERGGGSGGPEAARETPARLKEKILQWTGVKLRTREVVGSLSLEVLRAQLEKALGNETQRLVCFEQEVGPDEMQRSLPNSAVLWSC